MAPLGCFHSKSFSTSISPWIVTLDALRSSVADPPPSNQTDIDPFLICDAKDHGLFDLDFSAKVSRKEPLCFTQTATKDSQGKGAAAVEIAQSYLKHTYWTPYQMVAYNSLSGCGLNTDDLMATGTHFSPVSL